MGTLDNGLKREWLRLTAENARLRGALQRIANGGTSVLISAALDDCPINPDVLDQIVKDATAALAVTNGVRASEGK